MEKLKTGIELIAEERQEQIVKHGRTVDFDTEANSKYQLSDVAAVLASPTIQSARKRLLIMPTDWNETVLFKMCNKPYKERLIIAGALIAAEIDRLNALNQ